MKKSKHIFGYVFDVVETASTSSRIVIFVNLDEEIIFRLINSPEQGSNVIAEDLILGGILW